MIILKPPLATCHVRLGGIYLRMKKTIVWLISAGVFLILTLPSRAQSQSNTAVNNLLDKLEQKGVLTEEEASQLKAESAADQTNQVPPPQPAPSLWKISNTFKSVQLFGDVRFRYEYRGVDNLPGASQSTFYRERLRYAIRAGLRGDLVDNFYYGFRLETGTWGRSPWNTFGNNTTAGSVTPSDKATSGVNIGQIYLGWRPEDWVQLTIGRMPQMLYTTPMVWCPNINPEGFFEKFNVNAGNVNLFANFGQFDYQDPGATITAVDVPSSDLFVLAWQLGAKWNIDHDVFAEFAPAIYNYTGTGVKGNGLGLPFVGQGAAGVNLGIPGATPTNLALYNEVGVNNLLVLELPEEFDFKIRNVFPVTLQARIFGDFCLNLNGAARATAAYNANPAAFPGMTRPAIGQDKAFQVGFGLGSDGPLYGPTQGLVYGSTSQRNTWEARFYWQHVEQYALDPNLFDPDFFEGAANLQGFYVAFAYSLTDAIICTARYGYATRIDNKLGTGTSDIDIPALNPINNYNVAQMDLTWRF
jgi:hypothetical protein